MLDGRLLIDAHVHAPRLSTLKPAWRGWAERFGQPGWAEVFAEDGTVIPAALDDLMTAEGVDRAILLCEYSPKVTGIQAVEDMAALAGPRVRFAANVNPHLHHPVEDELARQLNLGAVALKVHPVHGGFAANDRAMYPAYAICQERGVPVVVHCGTSTFPGALNQYADPVLLDDVLRDFRRLDVVLAHGGRGWWYDAAAVLALSNERVWIELSGLPPSRLPTYYARHNWARLTRRMIFATDWPAVPGIAGNARAVAELCPDAETADLVLAGNAAAVYNLKLAS